MKCTKCGKELKEKQVIYLLKHKNGKYYFELHSAPVPADDIVSREPFGKTCAFEIGYLYERKVLHDIVFENDKH